MRGEDDVGRAPQGRVGRKRFRVEDIEDGAPQSPVRQALLKCGVIHDASPSHVHEAGFRFQAIESGRIDQAFGFQC